MEMCNAMSELGHEVFLVAPDVESHRIEKGVTDIYSFYGVNPDFEIVKLACPQIKGREYIYTLSIARWLKQVKPDLVVGRSIPGCWIATLLNFPTVFDSHGPVWERGRISAFIFKKMSRQPSFIKMTVNSLSLKKIYLENKAIIGDIRVEVAHNGARILEGRHELPGKNSFKVGYIGHLYPGRGIDILIEIAAGLNDIDFIIVGGTQHELEFWKSKAADLSNFYFMGFQPPSESYKYRNSCDVLLAPYQAKVGVAGGGGDQSRYQNPIKIIEYMSSRIPIIASDCSTIREILNEKNAVLVESSNVNDWVQALIRLKEDTALRDRLANVAFSDFINNYTWDSRAKKLITN